MESLSSFVPRIASRAVNCPSFIINNAVIDAIIEFSKKSEIFKITFDMGKSATDINAAKNNEIVFSITINDAKRPSKLISVSIGGASSYSIIDETLVYMKPGGNVANREELWDQEQKFYYFPTRTSIAIFPVDASELPDATTYFNFEMSLVPINDITEIDDEIYDDYREAIEAGALYRILSQPQAQWFNPSDAAYYKAEFNSLTAKAIGGIFHKSVLPNIKRTGFI